MKRSTLEIILEYNLIDAGYEFEAEYQFHPKRKWRFDFAFPAEMVAIEVQGGLHTAGRHTRGNALEHEYEKLCEAAILGWRVLFVSSRMVLSGDAVKYVNRIIRKGKRNENNQPN